jgi:hypothetical protein
MRDLDENAGKAPSLLTEFRERVNIQSLLPTEDEL